MIPLVHDSAQPLYHQIFIIVRGKIIRGEWSAGDRLPSELELMSQFQVSRTTIRLALDRLVNEGLIYRQRGRGTFVAAPRIEQDLHQGIRFVESLRQRELNASTKVLSSKMVPASDQTTIDLDVELDEPLAIIDSPATGEWRAGRHPVVLYWCNDAVRAFCTMTSPIVRSTTCLNSNTAFV